MSEIEDRRQRALEAFQDAIAPGNHERFMRAAREAFEVATTIMWGDEVAKAFDEYFLNQYHCGGNQRDNATALLAALGWELA